LEGWARRRGKKVPVRVGPGGRGKRSVSKKNILREIAKRKKEGSNPKIEDRNKSQKKKKQR